MGLMHIYCGDGKGKTTASIGLAVRASGSGMKVHFVQFMKGNYSSELNTLKSLPNITVERCDKNYGFTFNMSEDEKIALIKCHNRLIENAFNNKCDLLILDEFNTAYYCNLIDKKVADNLILNKPEHLELVLTGRNPDKKFMDIADYISEINCLRHPYKKGVKARKGIEF